MYTTLFLFLLLLGWLPYVHAGPIPSSGVYSFPCLNGPLEYVNGSPTCGVDNTGAGGVTSGVKTDINVIDADTNWTIVNDAITNAKAANMATSTIKGRVTASTGDPEDLSTAQVVTLLDPQLATDAQLAAAVAAAVATLQPLDAELTTLAGKTIAGTGGEIRMSTGVFGTNDCVMVNAAGSFTTAGAACGSGGGGTGDVTAAAAFGTDNVLIRSNGTAKGVQSSGAVLDDSNNLTVPGTIISGSGGSAAGVLTFTEGTSPTAAAPNTIQLQAPGDITTAYDLILPVAPASGVLIATNTAGVVSLTMDPNGGSPLSTRTAGVPTATDDESDGYVPFSRWIDTTTTPETVYVCTDATAGDAVWIRDSDTDTVTPTPTWQATANQTGGRIVANANSEANAVKVGVDNNADGDFLDGGGEGGTAIWMDGQGVHHKDYPDGNRNLDIPNTFARVWNYNGVEAMRLDSQTLKFNGVHRPRISFPWDAGGVSTDETGCAVPSEEVVNSGPKIWNFGCGDGGIIYGKVRLRTAIDTAAALSFTLAVRTLGTSTSNFNGDVSMMCRGAGATNNILNSTWGTNVTCDIPATGATANAIKECTATGIVPNGSCAAGDWFYWRYVIDSAQNTATAATAKVMGGIIGVVHSQLGE